MILDPIGVMEIFLVVVSASGLARLARLRGGRGWPWVVLMVLGYLYARGFGLILLGEGPDLLFGIAFIALMYGVVFLFVGRGRRLEGPWQCPVCELYNDPTTLVCPCGHRVEVG